MPKVTAGTDARNGLLRVGVVAIYHQPFRGLQGKLMKGLYNIVQILKIVQMIGVNI